MSEFTYEQGTTDYKLETYEWDNTWIEQSNDANAARVLYVGDSISCGVRRIATERSEKTIMFDGFGTSKALDNPYFLDTLRMFAAQQVKRDAVIFNNGLHGWHLDDEKEYGALYEEAVRFMLKEYEGTPIFLVLTTAVADEERLLRVQKRNQAALALAEKYGLFVIDLYKVSQENTDLRSTDGVHFFTAGYEKFADVIIAALKEKITL